MLVLTKEGSQPVKYWIDGVEFEEAAKEQCRLLASTPFIHR